MKTLSEILAKFLKNNARDTTYFITICLQTNMALSHISN
jgi:hypothetical protein